MDSLTRENPLWSNKEQRRRQETSSTYHLVVLVYGGYDKSILPEHKEAQNSIARGAHGMLVLTSVSARSRLEHHGGH